MNAICAHWSAVDQVAELLLNNPTRIVTGDEIRAAAATGTGRTVDPARVGTDFWPARYSRLVWRPRGMCRPNLRNRSPK